MLYGIFAILTLQYSDKPEESNEYVSKNVCSYIAGVPSK